MHKLTLSILTPIFLCAFNNQSHAATPPTPSDPAGTLIRGFAKYQAGRVENLILDEFVYELDANKYFQAFFPETSTAVNGYAGVSGKRLIPLIRETFDLDLERVRQIKKCISDAGDAKIFLDAVKKISRSDPKEGSKFDIYKIIGQSSQAAKCDLFKASQAVGSLQKVDEAANAVMKENEITTAERLAAKFVGKNKKELTIKEKKVDDLREAVSQLRSINSLNYAVKVDYGEYILETDDALSAVQSSASLFDAPPDATSQSGSDKPDKSTPNEELEQTIINAKKDIKKEDIKTGFSNTSADTRDSIDPNTKEPETSRTIAFNEIIKFIESHDDLRNITNDSNFYSRFKSGGLFLASLADASRNNDPVAVEGVIADFVDDKGAAQSKRKSRNIYEFTAGDRLYISSFYGFSFGSVSGGSDERDIDTSQARAFGPVGVEFKVFSNKVGAFSLNAAPLDLGNYITLELSDEDYDAKFEDIKAPSYFLSYTFNKRPVAFLIGRQNNLKLEDGERHDMNFVSIVFDLPIFRLF